MADRRRRVLVGGATVLVAVAAAFGVREVVSHDGGGTTASARDFRFAPREIRVRRGDPLVLRNDGAARHSFTADDGRFDTGVLEPKESTTVTLDGPRRIRFHCDVHPRMTGVVIVE